MTRETISSSRAVGPCAATPLNTAPIGRHTTHDARRCCGGGSVNNENLGEQSSNVDVVGANGRSWSLEWLRQKEAEKVESVSEPLTSCSVLEYCFLRVAHASDQTLDKLMCSGEWVT